MEGEVSVSIDGEATNGFSELRIYVGSQEVQKVNNLSLPFDATIETYLFNNGEQDIKAELDVEGEDSTLAQTVSATFENYLLKVNMDGYARYFKDFYDNAFLAVSDPQGEILGNVNLSDKAEKTLKLLPPKKVNKDPKYFNVTIGYSSSYDSAPKYLDTWIGFKSWDTVLEGPKPTISNSNTDKWLTIETNNLSSSISDYSIISEKEVGYSTSQQQNDTYFITVNHNQEAQNLITVLKPDYTLSHNTPIFKWEKQLGDLNLSDQDTITYDANSDFNEMTTHNVSHSSDLELLRYSYSMSLKKDAWDGGRGLFKFNYSEYDNNTSDSELGMFVPFSDHLFRTTIYMTSKTDERFSYRQYHQSLINEFTKLEAGSNIIVNSNFEEFDLNPFGEMDYYTLYTYNSDFTERWFFSFPDTMETFVVPKIEDFLDKGSLNLYRAVYYEIEGYDGYSDYVDSYWGSEAKEGGNYYEKVKNLYSPQKVKRKQFLNKNSPPHLRRQ